MATDASKKKPTAKEQGFPSAYLAANGNFKPGLDARAKSDLFAAVLDLDTSKALHKFEKPDAARLIKARGWEPLLEKKRQTIAAEAERAEKRKAERAEATKNAATSKASGRKTASVSSVGQAKPDPKPKRKAPATRQPGSRKKTASRGSVRRVK